MNKKRLLKLAEFLETEVPRERFDIRDFSQSRDFAAKKCNTAACALGWATVIPSFRRAGLEARKARFTNNIYPRFAGRSGYSAGMAFFDIDGEACFKLFAPHEYPVGNPTPKQVAKRIRKLVAEAA